MLMVKPNRSMNKKVPISATGNVSPVMTVERHEFKNRKTIRIVRPAPSRSVRRTLSTPTRIWREPSLMTLTCMPGCSAFSVGCSSVIAFCKPSATSIVFSPCAFKISSASVCWPLNSARLCCSCWLSTTVAIWLSNTGWPPRRATTMRLKSSGRLMRPCTCTTCSLANARTEPAGSSWFSLRTALTT